MGSQTLVAAAKASAAVHAFTVDRNQMAEGSAGAEAAKEFAPELQARAALANWLVDATLADFMGPVPPLLSPFTAPVRALNVHEASKSGLLALRDLDAEGLAAHKALRSLEPPQR